MDTHLEPNSEIVRLLRQWGDGAKQGDACEIEALRQYDVETLKGAMSTIFISGNAQIRIYAIDAMSHIVPPNVMIELLLPCLHDDRTFIRWKSCKMFQHYPDPLAMIPLMELLQKEKNPDTRVIAAEVLGKIGNEQAISILLNAVKNDKGKDFEGRTVATTARLAIAEIKARRKKING
jgi:hypothetical protein